MVIGRRSGVLAAWDTATWQQLAMVALQGTLTDGCWSPAGDNICALGGSGAACFDASVAWATPMRRPAGLTTPIRCWGPAGGYFRSRGGWLILRWAHLGLLSTMGGGHKYLGW